MEDLAVRPYDLFAVMKAAKDLMVSLALSAGRLMGLVLVMPVFKRTEVGRGVLFAIALALALPVRGALAPIGGAIDLDDHWLLIALTLKEVGVGALLGFLFGLPFWALQFAGELVDTQRSLAEGTGGDPAGGGRGSVMAGIVLTTAIVGFVSAGGLAHLIGAVWETYAVWPLSTFLPDVGALGSPLGYFGAAIGTALLTAAPFLIAFLLADLAMMAIGRSSGTIDISMLLPLAKNVIFASLLLLYFQGLFGNDPIRLPSFLP